MKKITAKGQEGYLHIVGEFDHVRKSYGGQILHEPRWAVNLHYTEGPRLPDEKVEDDRIELWWPCIVIVQRSGVMYYLDGETAMREFRITLPMPLTNPIFVFRVMGEPVEITGDEDSEPGNTEIPEDEDRE